MSGVGVRRRLGGLDGVLRRGVATAVRRARRRRGQRRPGRGRSGAGRLREGACQGGALRDRAGRLPLRDRDCPQPDPGSRQVGAASPRRPAGRPPRRSGYRAVGPGRAGGRAGGPCQGPRGVRPAHARSARRVARPRRGRGLPAGDCPAYRPHVERHPAATAARGGRTAPALPGRAHGAPAAGGRGPQDAGLAAARVAAGDRADRHFRHGRPVDGRLARPVPHRHPAPAVHARRPARP